jgi:hypothetical protein
MKYNFLKPIRILTSIFVLLQFPLLAQEQINERDVKKLYQMMQGFYSSEIQSFEDSSYYDICLKMVPMWTDFEGYWLYVEQAMSDSEAKPYRQRVYQLILANDSTIESRVYTIKNGEQYYGDWKYDNPLEGLTLDSLTERKGCSIWLHKNEDGSFYGTTNNSDCESNLRGATYATSKVMITRQQLDSWDQGFNDSGKQVWGATKGPYQFRKTSRF